MPAWASPSRMTGRAAHSLSFLAGKLGNQSVPTDPTPGVRVHRQGDATGEKLQGPLGRAPPLTDHMEQHLLELATGGSTALAHLHNELLGGQCLCINPGAGPRSHAGG